MKLVHSRAVNLSTGVSPAGSGGVLQFPSPVSRGGAHVAVTHGVEGNLAHAVSVMQAVGGPVLAEQPQPVARPALRVVITPETAFYRKYTEGMLRRYGVLKLQKGRVPSLLGREPFPGPATSSATRDWVSGRPRCLRLLDAEQQKLVTRVAVQEYTFGEAAGMLRWSLRSTKRRYHEAIDELTAIFQKRGLLEKVPGLKPAEACQEGEVGSMHVSYSSGMTSA